MIFKRGAWLYSLEKEITEKEFIEKSGGIEKVMEMRTYPFVSVVLDDKPFLVGHNNGRIISMTMSEHGHENWQTMEFK